MVTIERRVGGLLRYRKVWFPSREAALEISRSLKPSDVVRFFGASQDLGILPRLVRHRQLETVRLDLSVGPEGILKGMKRKSCRYEIQRAEKMLDHIEIEVDSSKARRDFLAVYNDFAKARNLPKFPAGWLEEYSTHAEILVLYLKGEPLCCHLLLCDSETGIVRLLYSGSRRLRSPEDAAACGALNRYLHWYELQRYHARGFGTFDFGGILQCDDSFARFKLSFGGSVVTENYYLLSGVQWIAKLGNHVYEKREKLLQRQVLDSKHADREQDAE